MLITIIVPKDTDATEKIFVILVVQKNVGIATTAMMYVLILLMVLA